MSDEKNAQSEETRTVRIYGASDDLVVIEDSLRGDDEIGCYNQKAVVLNLGGKARLYVAYGDTEEAVWSIKVAQVKEDILIPWPMMISQHPKGYSVVLEIGNLPDDVSVIREHYEPAT